MRAPFGLNAEIAAGLLFTSGSELTFDDDLSVLFINTL